MTPLILLLLALACAGAALYLLRLSSVVRARQEWAAARGFEFLKHDDFLMDEFTRGAAASGAQPKDIVVGQALGHELLLMDLGGVGVMAMRTGAASDVVVDLRRSGAFEDEASQDLLHVCELHGFEVHASEVAVAQRFIDSRVGTAMEHMPAAVTAVWLESDWVLAQTTKSARAQEWEQIVAPLALLADAARTLPPHSQAAMALKLDEGDPSRLMETQAASLAQGPVLVEPVEQAFTPPPISRPEEPVDMPTRVVGTSRGPVRHRAVGVDEVDAIADGHERPEDDGSRARMRRDVDGGSSIFGNER